MIKQVENHQDTTEQAEALRAEKTTMLFEVAVAFHNAAIVTERAGEIKGLFL